MNWKEFLADYLSFTRKERIGVLTVLLLVLSIFFLPKVVGVSNLKNTSKADTAWVTALQKLERAEDSTQNLNSYASENAANYQYDRQVKNYGKNKAELFFFDPNNLSDKEWQRLGLREKTIHTIQNYLRKGGHFRKPEDLQRIYGLFPNEYERIAPYIKINEPNKPKNNENFHNYSNESMPSKTKSSRYSIIEINTADTTAFITLPGIGSKLSARIINFRDKLGGFYSVDQVGETFGLPDSTFQKIKPYLQLENTFIRKININTASIDELKAHPYIRYSLAHPIITYRNEHGPFEKVGDIKKIMVVTDEVFNRIMPYLKTE